MKGTENHFRGEKYHRKIKKGDPEVNFKPTFLTKIKTFVSLSQIQVLKVKHIYQI
jgi:hypothetical protein